MKWTPHEDRENAFWAKFPSPRGAAVTYADVWLAPTCWVWTLTCRGVELARGRAPDVDLAKTAVINAWRKS